MLFSFLTALLFGVTPVFAARSARLLGPDRANLARLLVAVLPLGLWAHLAGRSTYGPSFPWFLLGGMVGFGIGGVSMFQALYRLGPNLSNLMVQCLSVLAAASVEWCWLGTRLSLPQAAFAALAVSGVALGLFPQRLPSLSRPAYFYGTLWALLSALAQGTGAVLSRKAFQVAKGMGDLIDPGTAAYERVLGGILVGALALVLAFLLHRPHQDSSASPLPSPGRAWPWVVANAVTGPVLGVTCYQWALKGNPAGIVQAVVATAPLLTIPLAAWLYHERPRATYYAGSILAVSAIAALWLTAAR